MTSWKKDVESWATERLELILFSAVFLILGIRISGLFQDNQLPGADGSSHFLALQLMAEHFLPNGHLSGYFLGWLGGISLFTFYGPFYFATVGGVWLLLGKVVSLELLFRLSIFAILCGISFSLWFFTKTFFGRAPARWAIPLSLLFLFYPKIYSGVGIGIGATIWVGLIPNSLGLIQALLWLTYIEKLRLNKDSYIYFLAITLSAASLILTHTLMFVAGVLSVLSYLFYHYRDIRFLKKSLASLALALLLATFWLVPFINQLPHTASDNGRIGDSVIDPLLVFFPINPLFILHPTLYPYVEFWAIGLFITMFVALRKQIFFAPNKGLALIFVVWWVLIVRDYLPTIFPGLGLHYQRLIAFLFLIGLALAADGIHDLWTNWANSTKRKRLFLLLVVAILFQTQVNFDLGTNDFNLTAKDLVSFRDPILWSWNDAPATQDGQEVLNKLQSLSNAQRVFVAMPYAAAFADLGSLHYFTSQIPLKNKQAVINGLYVESSPLTPFIIPTLDALTKRKELLVIGDTRLKGIETFYKQSPSIQLGRLAKLGLNYLVTHEPRLTKTIYNEKKQATLLWKNKNFHLFELKHARPLIYPATSKPALYINADRLIDFRDIAMPLFAGQKTFDTPVVESQQPPTEVTPSVASRFSVIIISASTLNKELMKNLLALPNPIILLNPEEEVEKVARQQKQGVVVVNNLEIIPRGLEGYFTEGPYGWAVFINEFEKLIRNYKVVKFNQLVPKLFSEKTIEFQAEGPIIINAGYSPYWQCRQGCDVVYQVSPANMLVFANGETILEYRADLTKKISIAISWATALGLFGYTLWYLRKKGVKKSV